MTDRLQCRRHDQTPIVLTGARTWTVNDGTAHPTGIWVEEFTTPHRIFTEAGHRITIATPGRVTPVADELSLAPAMIGGDQAAWSPELRAYLEASQETLAAAVPLFDGRRLTAFLDDEESQAGFADKAPWPLETRLRAQGAQFHAAPAWQSSVVVDGNLVTGQNPASSADAARVVLDQVSARR